jgi:hypothetical protein
LNYSPVPTTEGKYTVMLFTTIPPFYHSGLKYLQETYHTGNKAKPEINSDIKHNKTLKKVKQNSSRMKFK